MRRLVLAGARFIGEGSQFRFRWITSKMAINLVGAAKSPAGLCACVMLLALGVVAAVPPAGHVVIVVEENHSYSSVIGNSAMPYLNGLASQYGLATQYYANTHPSIGNYFMMT